MKKIVSRYFLIILFLLAFSSALPQESIDKSNSSALPEESTNKPICQTKECLFAAKNLNESMNATLNPCNNFYQYACGLWPNVHTAQHFMSPSTLKLRSEDNHREISAFLRQDNSPNEPKAVHMARKVFNLCLDKNAYPGTLDEIEAILLEIGLPVIPFEDVIKRYVDRYVDWDSLLARAYRLAGVRVYFNLGVGPNPYNRTENMITLKRPSVMVFDTNYIPMPKKPIGGHEEKYTKALDYIEKIAIKMCKHSSSNICALPAGNPLLMDRLHSWLIEQIIAQNMEMSRFWEMILGTRNSSSIPDIGIYSLAQLQELSNNIGYEERPDILKLNWGRYIEEMFTFLDNVKLNISDPHKVKIVIEDLDFVKRMLRFIYATRGQSNKMRIECDVWWQVVSTLLPYHDLDIFDAKNNLDAFGEFHPTREGRCKAIAITSFSRAIGHGYSMNEKYTKAKTKIAKMSEHIRKSFEQMIHQASWMDWKTKQKSLVKLQLMKITIGYPNINNTSLDDFYRDVQIYNYFLTTMVSKLQRDARNHLNKLNQTNDLDLQYWTSPHIINGFYLPNKNSLIIPCGLMGRPIYNDSLRALDYGAIGSLIGLEMSRVLDDIGRHYNEIGNMENWWQNKTLNSYKEKSNCFVDAYTSYNVSLGNGFRIWGDVEDSTADLIENIADNVGFKLALLAYRKSVFELGEEPLLPHFHNFTHEQLFTLSYANALCEKPTWTSVMNQTTGITNRSLNSIRVNGVLKNSKEFSEIWNCPKDSFMNPSNKCTIFRK